MQAMERITSHLRERPTQLRQFKEKGGKIAGFFVGDYVPEELIYAAGAVPIGMCHGGDPMPANAALAATTRFLCPFARAQYGERLLKEQPYYNLVDMVVVPITCQHLRRAGDLWDYFTDVRVFRLGIPHEYDGDNGLKYYHDRLVDLKGSLEELTGNKITEEALKKAIGLYNKMRDLLREIGLTRTAPNPPISTIDFIRLNHASLYADPEFMVDALDALYKEIKGKGGEGDVPDAPRLLLVGPNVAFGDYKVLELVNESGGLIVGEEICEGVRFYWQNVQTDGDPVNALTKRYLEDRLPCAFMRESAVKRFEFIKNLAKEFNVAGIIWYQLLYCDTYDIESYYFIQEMEKLGLPVLKLESDYDILDRGPLRTRIETFIETLKGR